MGLRPQHCGATGRRHLAFPFDTGPCRRRRPAVLRRFQPQPFHKKRRHPLGDGKQYLRSLWKRNQHSLARPHSSGYRRHGLCRGREHECFHQKRRIALDNWLQRHGPAGDRRYDEPQCPSQSHRRRCSDILIALGEPLPLERWHLDGHGKSIRRQAGPCYHLGGYTLWRIRSRAGGLGCDRDGCRLLAHAVHHKRWHRVGRNRVAAGQIGNTASSSWLDPSLSLASATDVEAGPNSSFFIRSDRTLWACGENTSGQLGIGSTVNQPTPLQVASSVGAVSAGSYHTLFSDLLPVILAEPQDQVIQAGSTAVLSVFTGGPAPISYQWYQGASGNTLIPVENAGLPTLQIQNLSETTKLWVRITNSHGTVDSRSALVTVVKGSAAYFAWADAHRSNWIGLAADPILTGTIFPLFWSSRSDGIQKPPITECLWISS